MQSFSKLVLRVPIGLRLFGRLADNLCVSEKGPLIAPGIN